MVILINPHDSESRTMASTFSPEIWQKFAEELRDTELRLLCGVHPAVFTTAMERFYRRFQLPFVPANAAISDYHPYLRSGFVKWRGHLENPLIARQIRELGLNLHSLDQLFASPPAANYNNNITVEQGAFLRIISNLGNIHSLCLCCHYPDKASLLGSETLRFIPRLVANVSSNLTSLSLRFPAAIFSCMTGDDAPSFPDLRLETLRISITEGYDRGHQSCPPDQLIALVRKTVPSVKSLGFYCWDMDFNMSDFLSSLGNMRLPHLEKLGLGFLPDSMPDAASLNKFLLAHNSSLTELSLAHVLGVGASYPGFYEWYRDCFRGVPFNQTLQKLQFSILYADDFMTPPYVSMLGSIYSSLESITLLSLPLSLYDVEMLLHSFTCDQVKSLKLNVRSLDTKLLDLLKERCPKLRELVLKLSHDDNETRVPMSRRILFEDALQEWKGNGEHEDWVLSQSLNMHRAEAFKCARRYLRYDMEMLTSSEKELFGDLCETCIHEDSDGLSIFQ